MKLKLIERPDLYDCEQFDHDEWFDTNLKDHYAVHKDDLVRVYDKGCPVYYEIENKGTIGAYENQAYLIKSSIEPIVKKCPTCGSEQSEPSTINEGEAEESVQETCADVLRDYLEVINTPNDFDWNAFEQRAKAALKRESAEGGPSVVGERSENNTRGES